MPRAIINRQLRAILIQDFEIKHVLGKKNVVVDALSRYPKLDSQVYLDKPKDDLEEFIKNLIANIDNGQLGGLQDLGKHLKAKYLEESKSIARFLLTTRTPTSIKRGNLRAQKKHALNFFTRNRYLFRKTSRNIAIRRVVDDEELRSIAIQEIYR